MRSALQVRLQKLLSSAGISSRRAAETLIREGRVSVNGITVSTLGARADPECDALRVDGRRVKLGRPRHYLLLNKPRGYVTTRRDPQGRPTVLDLVKSRYGYLYPVGRLDYDSEGLLLLTNDGELAARLTHPRHGIERRYEAEVRGVPSPEALGRLARGVSLDGRRTRPGSVRRLRVIRASSGNRAVIAFTIQEGRNRQVRRMCDAVGHPVVRLRRVRFGPIRDTVLPPGRVRELTAREVAALEAAAAMPRGTGGREPGRGARRRPTAAAPSRRAAGRPRATGDADR